MDQIAKAAAALWQAVDAATPDWLWTALIAPILVGVITGLILRRRRPRRSLLNRVQGHLFLWRLSFGPTVWRIPWSIRFDGSLGLYDLEYHGSDRALDVKIDLLRRRLPPKLASAYTQRVQVLPSGTPISMPLGPPKLARRLLVVVRWVDSAGQEWMSRVPVRAAFR